MYATVVLAIVVLILLVVMKRMLKYCINRRYVLFYSPTCPYCKPVLAIFRRLQAEGVAGKSIETVDITENRGLAEYYEITGVPTMLEIESATGQVLSQCTDRSFSGIKAWIES